MSERNVHLDDVILTGIDRVLSNVNTCLPGTVKTYDPVKQLCEVDIDIKKKLRGKFVVIPTLVNVPVIFPSGGGFSVSYPLKKGDKVICLFSQRSLDDWLEDINDDPKQVRRFDLSDAFAYPGGHTFKTPLGNVDANNLVIGLTSGTIQIDPSGNIFLHSKTASEAFVKGTSQKVEIDKDFNAMSALQSAINGWTPIPQDGGAALKVALAAFLGLPLGSTTGTLSTVIKGE